MRARKSRMPLLIAAVAALAVVAAGLLVLVLRYHIVDFKLYSRDSQRLDLRGEAVSVSHYEKLRSAMPECEILWDVPFQNGTLSCDTKEVTVTNLTLEDVSALTYLDQLETVDARECTDYDQLLALKKTLPQVQVNYQVLIAGRYYDQDTTMVKVSSITEDEIRLLPYLPALEGAVICGNEEAADFSKLRNYCLNMGLSFAVQIGQTVIPYETREVTAEGIEQSDVYLLGYLKELKKLHLVKPQADGETVKALREQYPEAQVTWEVEIEGQLYPDTTTEVDLSNTIVNDLAAVERGMSYLPDAEKVIFGVCGIDNQDWGNSKSKLPASRIENEDMSAYRDRVREDYKVVWTVRLGPHIALRTDVDNFMPNHFGVGRLPDSYAYNLRYCEDMVCLDVGHMTLTDISFVEYMPKLKYLILAWTEVQYIEPIRSCKNLIFLELDNSCIRDLSPLVDCTALQDLNIGNTWPDITPLTKMPWLKNVYMIFGSKGDAWTLSQALPDTRVVSSGNATVGGGWRRMQNYYDMRDCLGMYYMN